MTARMSRSMTGLEHSPERVKRAGLVAAQLQHEINVLLELFRDREKLSKDLRLSEGRLVSVPPASSQLEASDRLWRLHLALQQCRRLLEGAIRREEVEFGDGETSEYKSQRKTVNDRLSLLLGRTGDLLKAVGGTTPLSPDPEGIEIEGPTSGGLFQVKLWIYRVFTEVEHWSKTAVITLQELPTSTAKEPGRRRRTRNKRRALR